MLQHVHEERLIVLHAECVLAWDKDVFGEVGPDAMGAAEAVWTCDSWHLIFDVLLGCGEWFCVIGLEKPREDRAEGELVVAHCDLSCVLGHREKGWWCGWRCEGLRVLWEVEFIWNALVDVLGGAFQATWILDLLGAELNRTRREVDGGYVPDDILNLDREIEEVEGVVWVVRVDGLLHLGLGLDLLGWLIVEVGIEYLSIFCAQLWLAKEEVQHAGVDGGDSSADEALWDKTVVESGGYEAGSASEGWYSAADCCSLLLGREHLFNIGSG